MTSFEKYLIQNNYKRYSFSVKDGYKLADTYNVSTMGEIHYHYININDPIIDKINKDLSYSMDERLNVIVFGLNEVGKPPTLVYPRPNIELNAGSKVYYNDRDNAMNTCLRLESNKDILFAMFNKEKKFKYFI